MQKIQSAKVAYNRSPEEKQTSLQILQLVLKEARGVSVHILSVYRAINYVGMYPVGL